MTEGLEARRPVFPVYLFERRRHENPEIGLAGRLYFNTFGRRPKMRARREITEIIARLTAEAQAARREISTRMDGNEPVNAVDTSDEEVMRSWIKRAFKISLRVDLRSDDKRVLSPFDHDAQATRV